MAFVVFNDSKHNISATKLTFFKREKKKKKGLPSPLPRASLVWAHQPLPLQLPVWASRLPLWVTVGGQQSARHAPVVDSVPTMEGSSAQHPLLSNKGGCQDDSRAGWCRCSVWQYSGCLALRLMIHQLQSPVLCNHPSENKTLPSFIAHMKDAVLDTGYWTHDVLPKPRMLMKSLLIIEKLSKSL